MYDDIHESTDCSVEWISRLKDGGQMVFQEDMDLIGDIGIGISISQRLLLLFFEFIDCSF